MDKIGKDALIAKLEKLGVDRVRANLRNYGGKNRPTVDDWLQEKDRGASDERDRSKEAISRESLKAAKSANIIMIVSAVIAVIAIIVTVLIFYPQ